MVTIFSLAIGIPMLNVAFYKPHNSKEGGLEDPSLKNKHES